MPTKNPKDRRTALSARFDNNLYNRMLKCAEVKSAKDQMTVRVTNILEALVRRGLTKLEKELEIGQ